MTNLGKTQNTQLETMDAKMREMLAAISTSTTEQQEKSGKAMQDRLLSLERRFQTLDSIQSMVSEKLESNLKNRSVLSVNVWNKYIRALAKCRQLQPVSEI